MKTLPTSRSTREATGRRELFQRLATWILLLVYGIPAGIGPYWHQHDAPNSAESQSESHSGAECSASCCNAGQHHLSSQTKSRATDKTAVQATSKFHRDNCFCTTCAYYAQAVYLNDGTSIESSFVMDDLIQMPCESPWLLPIRRANSRGPPGARSSLS